MNKWWHRVMCRIGRHRFYFGTDHGREGRISVAAYCRDCGLINLWDVDL